jgi:hypothetical protein
MRANGDPEQNGADKRWALLAEDLKAYRESQRRTWGDIDEVTIARYVVGEATVEERARTERAMREYPAVRECVATVRDLIQIPAAGQRPAVETAAPTTLPFPSLEPVARTMGRLRRRPAIAAGLILALVGGLVVATWITGRSSRRTEPPAADVAERNPSEPSIQIASRPKDGIEYHVGESPRAATWNEIWESSYIDADSPPENLSRIFGAAGPDVKAFIDDLRKQKRTDSEILAELRRKYGQRHD